MKADERFKDVYVRYFARMKNFAVEYVLSEHDAENIVQDVFTDLWHRREILNYDVNLVALLFTSIKNRCIDLLRKRVVMNKVDILNKLTPYKLFKLTPIDNLCFQVGIYRS